MFDSLKNWMSNDFGKKVNMEYLAVSTLLLLALSFATLNYILRD